MGPAPPPAGLGPAPRADWLRARSAAGPAPSHPSPALAPRPRGRVPAAQRSLRPAVKVADCTERAPGRRSSGDPARAPQERCPGSPDLLRSLGLFQIAWVSLLRDLYRAAAARVGSSRSCEPGAAMADVRPLSSLAGVGNLWRVCWQELPSFSFMDDETRLQPQNAL